MMQQQINPQQQKVVGPERLRRLTGALFLAIVSVVVMAVGLVYSGWLTRLGLAVLIALTIFIVARLLWSLIQTIRMDQEAYRQAREQSQEYKLARQKIEAELAEAQARARKAVLESEYSVVSAPKDHGVWVREFNKQAVYTALHSNPRHRVNGVDTDPSPLEIQTWQAWRGGGAKQLPSASASEGLLGGGATLPDTIRLDEIFAGQGSLRNMVLGVRVDKNGLLRTVSAPLERMVHIGAAGATDSGKSNFGRVLAIQAATAPSHLSLVFVDLKMTTFKLFQNLPRLRCPLVTSAEDFTEVMADLSGELERRKDLFRRHMTVETLAEYNREADVPLDRIIVFIDEVTNLFMTNDVRDIALKMVRESRAFGINFINLGQSWSHKEMDTSFREQHRTTGHFATNNPRSSQMMIHSSDAADIQIPGRAYFLLPFTVAPTPRAVEIQTPLLEPVQALRMLSSISAEAAPVAPAPAPVVIETEAEATSTASDDFVPADEEQPPAGPEESNLSDAEQRVLEAWDAGERRITEIGAYGYGKKGGKQNDLARDVLIRLGRIEA